MKRILQTAVILACLVTSASGAAFGSARPAPWRTKHPAHTPADDASASAEIYVETNAYGFVTHASVRSASSVGFGQACLKAVRQWRYHPARENGFPVPARFVQPMRRGDGTAGNTALSTSEP